ncbi:MAG: NUDIX hydrolase [Candidatus Bipolaricaulota bacterium]
MRYYVESDGRVLLVRRGRELDLPAPDEISVPVDRIARLPVEPETWFCVPRLEAHPAGWPSKDEVPTLTDTTPLARAAVHATMPRVVVEAICIENGEVLLVKGSRGLNEGRWSLPGGFLRFGETPEDGVLREVLEEVGAEADLVRPAGTRSWLGARSGLHWIMFFYRIRLRGRPNPNPDEIAEAGYVPIAEARLRLHDPAMADAVCREAARSD